jgi:hypothetical protein
MAYNELHIAETAPWRALLTHAQLVAGIRLSPPVEEHLVALLFRHVGSGAAAHDIELGFLARLECLAEADASDPAVVGDQCVLFAGLFPEHAIRKGVPVAYFVEVGRHAYREYSSRHRSAVHGLLAQEFVRVMDTLQTLRVLQSGEPCLDGFNAYYLWRELGSAHGWHMLRRMTRSLPAACGTSDRLQ